MNFIIKIKLPIYLKAYLSSHWCPAEDADAPNCPDQVGFWTAEYTKMLDIVVVHFFLDGAIQMCQAEQVLSLIHI